MQLYIFAPYYINQAKIYFIMQCREGEYDDFK